MITEASPEIVAVPLIDLQKLIAAATSPWLGIDQAAEYCGVSRDSIETAIASGRITAHRGIVRGRVQIDRRELDSVIRSSVATPRTGRGIRSRNH